MRKFENIIKDKILSITPLSGGCIGASYKVVTNKETLFVKEYASSGIAEKEANGLKELSKSKTIYIPLVINVDSRHIVLEYIESSTPNNDFQYRLGNKLAQLHSIKSDRFGFNENNYIGQTKQINCYKDNWITFYTENRLDYQISLLKNQGEIVEKYSDLRKIIPRIIGDSGEEPTLIHGDLWNGNYMCSAINEPVLIDPAVYDGHRELELALTKIFGGFTSDFYKGYQKTYPLIKDWEKRENLYKLYHILNHLNLFGNSYSGEVLYLINSYLNQNL